MPDHCGHRERVRERFCREGLDSFTDIQVLELLLFYCIPRRDTNEVAHALLERFGSLPQVLEASVEELCKVDGIGENAAVFLQLIPQAGRYYMTSRANQTNVLHSLENCASYLLPRFVGRTVETVYILCLDAKCKVLCCRIIAEGEVNSAVVSPRKVVEAALSVKAAAVVLAHNHPGGLAIPSGEDLAATKMIADALNAVDIQLVDHIVVADDDYVSIVQSGYFPGSS